MGRGKKEEPKAPEVEPTEVTPGVEPEIEPVVEETPIEATEAEEEAPVPVEPTKTTEVQLSSLRNAELFELKGERYRVADRAESFSVVYKLKEESYAGRPMWVVTGQATLGAHTTVKPIK